MRKCKLVIIKDKKPKWGKLMLVFFVMDTKISYFQIISCSEFCDHGVLKEMRIILLVDFMQKSENTIVRWPHFVNILEIVFWKFEDVSRITNTVAQQPRWGGTSFGTLEIEAVKAQKIFERIRINYRRFKREENCEEFSKNQRYI